MNSIKKIISVITAAVLDFACLGTAFAADESKGAYKNVFIIGVDGAGRFIKDADTPNFDRIFGNGAVDYTALTEVPTDSGPNWGSILTGVFHISSIKSTTVIRVRFSAQVIRNTPRFSPIHAALCPTLSLPRL